MYNQLFVANTPAVASEIIDGEAIIMSLDSGSYYSSTGVGAAIWELILARRSTAHIKIAIQHAYEANEDVVETDLQAFLDNLLSENLVRAEPVDSAADGDELPKRAEPYVRPEIAAYTDMRDLLTLDPIHDTAEMGWPIQKKD